VKCHRLEECDWQRLNTPRGEPGVVEAELVKVSLDRMQAEFPRRIIADSVVPYCVSCRPPIKPPHGSTVIRDLLTNARECSLRQRPGLTRTPLPGALPSLPGGHEHRSGSES
jgi:hypothetical protein